MVRGFGIAATTDPELVEAVARLAEELGYSTVWTNDNPMSADGLEVAARMITATTRIRIGIGVMPIDSRPPPSIASRLEKLHIPLDRVVLGIGAGFSPKPLQAVSTATDELHALLGESATIGLAAMGPRMCSLAGRIADLVLLNWMIPERIRWARSLIEKGGRAPELAAYVRCAIEPDAADRINEEAARYRHLPHYRRHFDQMAAQPPIGVALDENIDPQLELNAYDAALDETVVRALPAPEEPKQILDIARIAAPEDKGLVTSL
jgi:alkanesulfonate monooxygenase SsuD/methylene tetrahydromethanopterin reductase-like flavin-dependent oxidoreductase (luciferase family)